MKSKRCGQLIMAVVVEALYSGFLDRAVHPFDLSVDPGMAGSGQFTASLCRRKGFVPCSALAGP